MVSCEQTQSESYPAVPTSVGLARRAAIGFARDAGLRLDRVDDVGLAVSEAVTNAVRHGYRGGPGEVRLTLAVAGGELWILVTDDGRGFQAPAFDPGLGLGLALIAGVTEDFEILQRGGGGTEVRMRFLLPPVSGTA